MSGRRKAAASASPLGFLGAGLSYLALCLAALAALVLVVVPLLTGSQTYSVLTSSMAPKYAPGTFLVVKPVPFEELRVGDIITYQIESGSPAVITHRITAISAAQSGELEFITKGDNNDVEDELPVRELQVRGKLFYAVPFVGFVANALGNSDRGAAAQWGAVALMGYGVISLVRGSLAKRRENGSQDDSLDPSRNGDGPGEGGYGDDAESTDDDHPEYADPLEYDDPILTDCDCDTPAKHRHSMSYRTPAGV
ncbi:signal peptidase I [Arthrobacter sp. zg-Y826]|uniref:signal peptidase I n=1 Tax=Arthrobacter jinronghuae TaxID=2964609 RepID=UPI0021070E06|nr:signal peptidase I [Arthrobacter jinronghuae]MCQ1957280.1 signal peptidase I [Arthrobacter jinronghuae]